MVKFIALATTTFLMLMGWPISIGASEPPSDASDAAKLGELEVRSTNDEGYNAARLNDLAAKINRNAGASNSQQPDSPIQIPRDIHVFESGGRAAVGTKLD